MVGKETWKTLRDFILARPQMFIGHPWWGTGALYTLVFGVIKRAAQVENYNECSRINVELHQKDKLIIEDDGRGLPVDPIVFSMSGARPKLERVLTHYLVTGVPTSYYFQTFGFLDHFGGVMSAVSARLAVETSVHEKRYSLTCAKGEVIEPLQELGLSTKRGTRIAFSPDPDVFGKDMFDGEPLWNGVRELASRYPHVQFNYEGKMFYSEG